MRRVQLAAKRALFAGRMVVFYCDLDERELRPVDFPKNLRVERLRALAELSSTRLQEITSFWNAKLAYRSIRERFEKGASLWLLESEDHFAGYGWTLQGSTVEPYYFPLAKDDVHLFDFHVFPDYRGRSLNPYLIGRILDVLAVERAGRAFIEAAEWNDAQLASLRKTPFQRLGVARSFTILGHTFASWAENKPATQIVHSAEPADQMLQAMISNEQNTAAPGQHDAPAPVSPRSLFD